MRIAVNAIFLQKDHLEGYGHFVQEIIRRLVLQHPEHEFIFVFDRPYDQKFIYASNVTPLVVSPAARHPLAFFTWYNLKAPLALRKYQPDVWWQPYGFCSLFTRIPQLLVVHDLAFLHYPKFIPWYHRLYYRFFTKRFLQKATSILAVSGFTKEDLQKNYQIPGHKLVVVPEAAREIFRPMDFDGKETIKQKFTGGKEYFLFTGGIHPRKNLLNLLKAFSLFKKWQRSNMKLVIAGRLAWQYDDFLEKLKTYKYRDDVVLTGYVTDEVLAQLTASAYAMIYPSLLEGFGLPILEAMQSGVTVVASNTGSMPETGGTAALYADPNDPDAIALHLLAIYRDENKRSELVRQGLERAAAFTWDNTASQVWKALCDTAAGA